MSLYRRAAVVLALALAGAGLSQPSAEAADQWAVPDRARITINGHGYGHGHGMSQYGAEGAARQGLSYREIVNFYYPGTTWGSSRGRVTVLIGADTSDDLEVVARRGLTVRDTAGGGRVMLPDNGATRWRIAVADNGDNRVAYKINRWHRWRTLGGRGEFFAGDAPIALVTPSGQRAYRGRLRAEPVAAGSRARDTVNDIALDSYLKGVVPLEMPATWSRAAVRSQAVAARTYASYERAHPRTSRYQICDTTACQVYGGYVAEHPASNKAIEDTRGEILTHRGEAAFTQFASSSGGWTSAGSMPYLRAKADPYDGWSGNPVHSWSVTVDDTRIERAFPAVGNLTRLAVRARDGNGQWGGRVQTLKITGAKGSVTVSGDTFRYALGLRSTWVNFGVRRR